MECAVMCIVIVTKWKGMRWSGNVARMGRSELNAGIWCEYLKERDYMEDVATDGFIEMDRKEMFGEGADCIDLARDSDQTNTCFAWNAFFGRQVELLASQGDILVGKGLGKSDSAASKCVFMLNVFTAYSRTTD
jgi:hypothetical protein